MFGYRSHRTHTVLGVFAVAVLIATGLIGIRLWRDKPSVLPSATPPQANPPLADTNYPVPAGALYVAPTGADSNNGTATAPFKTVSAALAAAKAGGTVVVRQGTYRESLGSISRPVTLQAYPHEKVWLKGSIVVTNFVPSGAAWMASGFNSGLCQNCFSAANLDPNYPNAGRPEQVFVDGEPLPQVASRAAVQPGNFFYDDVAKALWLGSDPAGHVIEATNKAEAVRLLSTAIGSVVRGIGIAQYGPQESMKNIPAALTVLASKVTVENTTIAQSASRGAVFLASAPVIRGNTFALNGYNGLVGNAASNGLFEGNTVTQNNLEHFSLAATAVASCAGAKFTNTSNFVARDNIVSDNWCNGLWFDISSNYVTIVRNLVQRNSKQGIFLEIGGHYVVASNVSTDNGSEGLKLSGVTDAAVWNNTFANNVDAQVGVYEDPRSTTNASLVKIGVTWNTGAVVFSNNIFSSSSPTTWPTLHILDLNTKKSYSAASMITSMDHDAWARSTPGAPTVLTNWPDATGKSVNLKNIPSVQSAAAVETNGWGGDNAVSPFFVDEAAGDYSLKSPNPGAGQGAPLPAAVAGALGVSPGGPVTLGALSWPKPAPAVVAPLPPQAVIVTPSCSGLACTFDASHSTDPDGTISAWTWDFGDGSGATGAATSHPFVGTGTYTVSVTVTDSQGLLSTASSAVSVVRPNVKPTAVATASCSAYDCTFDGNSSSDPDGYLATYHWDFGDGAGFDGPTASHNYAVAGTWTATFTVTDDVGASDVATVAVNPAPAPLPRVLAADAFGRLSSNGWGTADQGGSWVPVTGTGNLDAIGGAATLRLPGPGLGASTFLSGSDTVDADASVLLNIDKLANGGGLYAALLSRWTASNDAYRIRLRVAPAGRVYLQAQAQSSTGAVVNITPEQAAGLNVTPGLGLRVRIQTQGTNPTTLRARVWADGTTEPTTWNLQTSDATAALQQSGTVGLLGFLGSGTSNAPLVLSVAEFTVVPVVMPPTPLATVHCTGLDCTFDASGSVDFAGGGLLTSWSFGDNSTSQGATTSHTFGQPGTYSVTCTIEDTLGQKVAKVLVITV